MNRLTAVSECKTAEKTQLTGGEPAEVTGIEEEQLKEPIKVYNLEVEDLHTYYVSEQQVLVHNTCGKVTSKKAKTSKPSSGSGNRSNGSTGTIYDSIHATQNVYEGTSIPKSFNIDVGENQLWVHPNATEHMNEYVTKNNQHIGTFTASVSSQTMLSEFGSALNLAISKNNIRTDKIITGGNWEFKFAEPKAEGLNYVVIHARFLNK